MEEFERVNTLSKKVVVPPEKAMTRVPFPQLPAKAKLPKIKVKWALRLSQQKEQQKGQIVTFLS